MILADTSVWVRHFRHGSAELANLLASGQVAMHPFILGELACGNLSRRGETLRLLRRLPGATLLSDSEVHAMVEARRLYGRGLGWVDMHLLGAALADGHRLWTLDRRLGDQAAAMGINHS